jgi:hypothetical protein
VIPSGEVRIVLTVATGTVPPTATNCAPDQEIPNKLFVVPEARDVHVIPSGEVRIVPPSPTAMNCAPFQEVPNRLFVVPEVRDVIGIPVTVIGT